MPQVPQSIERDVYEDLAATGGLNGFPFEGWFVDAGTPTSCIEASQACITGEKFSSGSSDGDSWFGEGSKSTGVVVASSVGKNASVGNGTVIRDSVILEGATIGPGCDLEGCLIGMGAIIPGGSKLHAGDQKVLFFYRFRYLKPTYGSRGLVNRFGRPAAFLIRTHRERSI